MTTMTTIPLYVLSDVAARYAHIEYLEDHPGVLPWYGQCLVCNSTDKKYEGKTMGFMSRTLAETDQMFVEHLKRVHLNEMKHELSDLIYRTTKKLARKESDNSFNLTLIQRRQFEIALGCYDEELRFLQNL